MIAEPEAAGLLNLGHIADKGHHLQLSQLSEAYQSAEVGPQKMAMVQKICCFQAALGQRHSVGGSLSN